MPSASHMSGREWGLLLILSVLWGCSYFFFKILAAEWPPMTIVLGRVCIAAVALNVLLRARGLQLPRDAASWRSLLLMGAINNVIPFAMIIYGETRISSGLASILNGMSPIFSVLIAHLFTTTEKLTLNKLVGVGFGFAGVAVLLGPDAIGALGNVDLRGAGACLIAALSYAVAGIYGRRFRGTPPLIVATAQITGSALLSLPLCLLIDHPWTLAPLSPHALMALVALALFSTALAYVIYFRILATAGATNVLLVTLLVPISALLLGALFLHERVTVLAVAGMLLIGLGLAAIDGRLILSLRRTARRLSGPA